LALIASLPPHHGESPSLMSSATESPFASFHEPFFNSIDPIRTFPPPARLPAAWPQGKQRGKLPRTYFEGTLGQRTHKATAYSHPVGRCGWL
jgi:hypothetical protein